MGQCKSGENYKCVKCGFIPTKDSSNKYLSEVLKHDCVKIKPILKQNTTNNNFNGKTSQIKKLCKNDKNNKIKVKVPIDQSNTQFKWTEVPVLNIKHEIIELPAENIKKRQFQEKIAWFRERIDRIKKQNSVGCDVIQVDRDNLIQSSLNALEGLNLFRDLKIQFKGDKAEDAGGGLLRQWMHLCIKEIMSEELGIFQQSNTDETAYHLLADTSASDQLSFQALYLLGLVISKAIIQKISLDCHLDYTIIRQLCSQPVHLSDIYSYDKQLYQSWKNILQMPNVEELCLDGTIYQRSNEGKTQQIQILPNGKNIKITNQNKQEFISEMINFYSSKNIQSYLQELFKSITSIISSQWISIFEPYEFDMITSGPSVIDIQDWKNNTIYDCYEPSDQVIQWFWEIVESYDQKGFRNLLHYCTGSMRVPIMGFAKLESSHGHIKKFTIRKIDYDVDNPYPKSYTCFNRLDLPNYSSKQQLKLRLSFILQEEFSYFGLC